MHIIPLCVNDAVQKKNGQIPPVFARI